MPHSAGMSIPESPDITANGPFTISTDSSPALSIAQHLQPLTSLSFLSPTQPSLPLCFSLSYILKVTCWLRVFLTCCSSHFGLL